VGSVPVVLAGAPAWVKGITDGRLADVAPSLLALLGLPQPAEMTGHSLLVETAAEGSPLPLRAAD
jgi:2,3-bisphosphoglycerate-independent phosphoglycerate mutase